MRRIDRDIERTYRDIEWSQAAVRRRAQRSRPRVYGGTGASVEPVGAAKAEQYAKHPHPSTQRFGATS